MTTSGDHLEYPGDSSSSSASILNAKIHINSTVYDAHKVSHYMSIEFKNFYLSTPMKYYQYLCVYRPLIPDEFIEESQFTV